MILFWEDLGIVLWICSWVGVRALERRADRQMSQARQFCAWIERSKRPPFVLITDWREAQPCLRAVTQHGGSNIPSHMVRSEPL
eukprot:2176971-Amphidinium_carterae.1